jgi:hypothetical protein
MKKIGPKKRKIPYFVFPIAGVVSAVIIFVISLAVGQYSIKRLVRAGLDRGRVPSILLFNFIIFIII